MKDQHTLIKGYRELSQIEIDLMNKVKALASEVERLYQDLLHTKEVDGRWLAIGKTDLQIGFMALVRAIAKPTTF